MCVFAVCLFLPQLHVSWIWVQFTELVKISPVLLLFKEFVMEYGSAVGVYIFESIVSPHAENTGCRERGENELLV